MNIYAHRVSKKLYLRSGLDGHRFCKDFFH
jgi:hypothetical protein